MPSTDAAAEPPAARPDVVALRAFVPARDLQTSLAFYADLGFAIRPMGDDLANVSLGPFAFLLQRFYVAEHAGNFMMHLLVEDIGPWWDRIAALDLATRYGVRPPTAPAMQPWGLVVSYVVDPTGVLWHIAEERRG